MSRSFIEIVLLYCSSILQLLSSNVFSSPSFLLIYLMKSELFFMAWPGELIEFWLTFRMPESARPFSLAFCFICLMMDVDCKCLWFVKDLLRWPGNSLDRNVWYLLDLMRFVVVCRPIFIRADVESSFEIRRLLCVIGDSLAGSSKQLMRCFFIFCLLVPLTGVDVVLFTFKSSAILRLNDLL